MLNIQLNREKRIEVSSFTEHQLLRISVYTTTIVDVDNALLLQELEQTSNAIPSQLRDGFGSLTNQTYFEDMSFPYGSPESGKLLTFISMAVSDLCQREMLISEAWAIKLHHGQSVMAHSHRVNTHMFPSEYYSVAYYADAPEDSAKLVFEVGHSNIEESIHMITPSTGMLVIFNSYLKHMTTRHNALTPRTVISANLVPAEPQRQACPDLSAYRLGT